MLIRIYREVIFLGVVSFCLFLLRYTDIADDIGAWFNEEPEEAVVLIEDIHMVMVVCWVGGVDGHHRRCFSA